jgi:hypothetical protein
MKTEWNAEVSAAYKGRSRETLKKPNNPEAEMFDRNVGHDAIGDTGISCRARSH